MKKPIDGFDYQAGAPVSLTRQEWIGRVSLAVRAGARRRVENGETFVHGANGRLMFEVYANIPERP